MPFGGGRRDAGVLIESIDELRGTHRVRIESGKLPARDELLRKRLLVLLQLLLPTGGVDDNAITDFLRVAHELNEARQTVRAIQRRIVEAIDEITRSLEARSRESKRQKHSVDALYIRTATHDLVCPKRVTAWIGLTAQEILIMLVDEELRIVNRIGRRDETRLPTAEIVV